MTDCPLTAHELAVVKWLADGHIVPDIAEIEEKSPEAIKTRVQKARHKTGAATAAGLVGMALRNGWIK